MIARRFWAMTPPLPSKWPCASGPRCSRRGIWASMTAGKPSRSRATTPLIPHIRQSIPRAAPEPARWVMGDEEPSIELGVKREFRVLCKEISDSRQGPRAIATEAGQFIDDPVLNQQQASFGHQWGVAVELR